MEDYEAQTIGHCIQDMNIILSKARDESTKRYLRGRIDAYKNTLILCYMSRYIPKEDD